MCFQVYLGSDVPCREIPFSPRSDDRSRFPDAIQVDLFVKAMGSASRQRVIALQNRFQYWLGILDCGCGFSYHGPASELADDGWTLNNHKQLAEYVAECLERAAPITIYSCWSGDEGLPVEHERQISLPELRSPEFFFEERQITRVYRTPEELKAPMKG